MWDPLSANKVDGAVNNRKKVAAAMMSVLLFMASYSFQQKNTASFENRVPQVILFCFALRG